LNPPKIIDSHVRACKHLSMNVNDLDLVKSASRVLYIFEIFAKTGRAMPLAELARELAIPRSSCLALLRTLSSRGYLYSVGTNGYYPTRLLYEMAEVIARHDPLIESVLPIATALRDRTQETVILGKRQDDRVIYLLVIESEQTIRYSAHPGYFKPLHGSASGKALLGVLPDDERQALLKRLELPVITPRTITDPQELEKDLVAGAARGWQFTEGENVPDVIAIAAPVRLNGEVHAMVVTGPTHRMKPEVERHGRSLVEACRLLESGRTASDQNNPSN
jgi:IclR family acetate operon transcriptional repressor